MAFFLLVSIRDNFIAKDGRDRAMENARGKITFWGTEPCLKTILDDMVDFIKILLVFLTSSLFFVGCGDESSMGSKDSMDLLESNSSITVDTVYEISGKCEIASSGNILFTQGGSFECVGGEWVAISSSSINSSSSSTTRESKSK